MKILITGAGGYLGYRLYQHISLVKSIDEVLISSTKKASLFPRGNVIGLDYNSVKKLASSIKGVNLIMHLCSLPAVKCSYDISMARQINVDRTKILIEAAELAQVESFIYFSTIHVYGPNLRGLIDENSSVYNIMHPYAKTKLEAENLILSSKIPYPIILRLSNVYGQPGLNDCVGWNLVCNNIVREIASSRTITLLSQVDICRDYIYINNLLHLIEFIINNYDKTKLTTYNISSGTTLSLSGLTNVVIDAWSTISNEKCKISSSFPILKSKQKVEFTISSERFYDEFKLYLPVNTGIRENLVQFLKSMI